MPQSRDILGQSEDTLPLLEAYVEAAASHRTVSELLNAYSSEMLRDDATLRMYDKASQIQTRTAGTLAQMAIKMRLSQSSRYGSRGASGAHPARRPPA